MNRDEALLERVRSLVERLRPAAEYERPATAKIAWEVNICRKCNENASAMAGGKLLVGEEFIADLNPTDDELAYCWPTRWGMSSPNTPASSPPLLATSSAWE